MCSPTWVLIGIRTVGVDIDGVFIVNSNVAGGIRSASRVTENDSNKKVQSQNLAPEFPGLPVVTVPNICFDHAKYDEPVIAF